MQCSLQEVMCAAGTNGTLHYPSSIFAVKFFSIRFGFFSFRVQLLSIFSLKFCLFLLLIYSVLVLVVITR